MKIEPVQCALIERFGADVFYRCRRYDKQVEELPGEVPIADRARADPAFDFFGRL